MVVSSLWFVRFSAVQCRFFRSFALPLDLHYSLVEVLNQLPYGRSVGGVYVCLCVG